MRAGCCCRGWWSITGSRPGDPFRLTENATQAAIASHLLGERPVGIVEVGELVCAA